MSARSCRWCGRRLPVRLGRPPSWCGSECRSRYRTVLGTLRHAGSVELVERCREPGCHLDGSTMMLPGPVTAPGRWLAAAVQSAEALHGHAIEVTATPRPIGLGSLTLDRVPAGVNLDG